MMVNRSLLLELELNKYLDMTTSKAQLISAFETSCLLGHMVIIVCFGEHTSLESFTSLFNQVKALDKGSVRLKNEIRVPFGNLSPCLVPSA